MKRTGSPTAQAPHEASGHQTLSAYIRARFDEFSRSQKDVAQYIVDHLDEVAFQTAEELARRANTSSSTVVRFSQALGFDAGPLSWLLEKWGYNVVLVGSGLLCLARGVTVRD